MCVAEAMVICQASMQCINLSMQMYVTFHLETYMFVKNGSQRVALQPTISPVNYRANSWAYSNNTLKGVDYLKS